MHPILFHLGPLTLSTYGTLVALGYLAGILWLKSQIQWMPAMTEDKFWILIYGLFFGAIVGGKLLYLLVNYRDVLSGDYHWLRDFRYGFVFYGGLLGVMAMGLIIARKIRVPFLAVADYFGAVTPLGHAIGRLGCLGSGCCYGKPTSSPWGLALGGHPASTTPRHLWGIPLHPTQLYEAAGNLLILALLYILLPKVKKKQTVPGSVFLLYLVLYSVCRFIVEFFRGDDRGWIWMSLWISQWLAAVCAISGAVMLVGRGIFTRDGR